MKSHIEYKRDTIENNTEKEEQDVLRHEFDIIQTMINVRNEQNITQKELSEKTGITQADISRIENGTRNPSLAMVKRLAEGLGMRLKLEFIQNTVNN